MQFDLNNKNILLAVTGSISAYKACDIARLFVNSGANVYVVMSRSACRFISPLTFEALTRNSVLTDDSESWATDLNHIEIGKKCDIMLIAPATANTINKLSKGIADNILLQSALAFNKPIIIAPSANSQMLENHYTVGSLKMLAVNDCQIVEPQTKLLACGDVGKGALASIDEIYHSSVLSLYQDEFWRDRKVVVTGGGTIEKIDEIRYISNFSSGKMAESLVLALYSRGADVCYITTKKDIELPKGVYIIEVESAKEMFDYTIDAVRVAKKGKMSRATMNSSEPIHLIQKEPFLFMVSAVADYTPKFPQSGKMKKSMIGEEWSLELTQTEDILSNINRDGIKVIGFKAEMDGDSGFDSAKSMLRDKKLDYVCFNLLKDSKSFGSDDNEIVLISEDGEIDLGRDSKLNLSLKILDNLSSDI
jgi:phosphopantothenoylcysteine decarboxylase/phosphopantothenate--cysteine ligase